MFPKQTLFSGGFISAEAKTWMFGSNRNEKQNSTCLRLALPLWPRDMPSPQDLAACPIFEILALNFDSTSLLTQVDGAQ